MKSLFRFLGRAFAVLGIGSLAMISIAWVGGQNLGNRGGALWAELHSSSLLNFQTVVQRHLDLPGLWDGVIIPILELPAWVGLAGIGIILLLLAVVFTVIGHEGPQSGNAFENTPES